MVRQTLEGHGELLKERTIGADVSDRAPEGITAENSVVRKQAGETRRSLDDYYQDANRTVGDPSLQILLPVGSCVPRFGFCIAIPSSAKSSSLASATAAPSQAQSERPSALRKRLIRRWAAVTTAVVLAAISISIWAIPRNSVSYPLFYQFWEPVSGSAESVVVCIAKPVVFIRSQKFFQKYSTAHGSDFGLQWQRLNKPLPKNLDMVPAWSDMQVQEDYGIARGDAEAAYRMAALFARVSILRQWGTRPKVWTIRQGTKGTSRI